jgi:RNA polymerase primary sigma factor
MTQYLKDLSTLATLTREEEIELALRIQRGDREAIRKLVEGNLRFVISVAAKYRGSRVPLADLINEGNIGLIKAAEKFNPEKGVKFITYAVWWVVASIKHALAKQTGVIGLPLKHHNTVYRINRKEEELSRVIARKPTRDEVAEAMGLTRQDVDVNLGAASTPLFLDASISDDPSLSYLNTLKADFQLDEGLVAENLRDEIESLVEVLSKRERDIISMRFGFGDHEPMTLRKIGKIMRLSKERIRQIEAKALEQLHEAAKARKLEAFLS